LPVKQIVVIWTECGSLLETWVVASFVSDMVNKSGEEMEKVLGFLKGVSDQISALIL
jgi:hypothetical protein